MFDDHETVLSAAASRRRRDALPELLGAVRWRRRRRHAARVAAALALLLLPLSWARWPRPPQLRPDPGGQVTQAAAWTEFADDPSVLARCEVVPRVDPEWFVDDAGLQRLLREDARPAGLVRTGPRVLVAAAAIDPWPRGAP